MAKKLTKVELVTALTAAGVPVSPSATVMQLRSLYDAEGIVENGVATVQNEESADEDGENDAAIAKLEKKCKFLLLQKEVRALENEVAEGVQSLSVSDIDNIVPKFSGDNAYSIEKWHTDFENAMKICNVSGHQIKDCPKKANAIVHLVQQDDNVQPIDVNQKWQSY